MAYLAPLGSVVNFTATADPLNPPLGNAVNFTGGVTGSETTGAGFGEVIVGGMATAEFLFSAVGSGLVEISGVALAEITPARIMAVGTGVVRLSGIAFSEGFVGYAESTIPLSGNAFVLRGVRAAAAGKVKLGGKGVANNGAVCRGLGAVKFVGTSRGEHYRRVSSVAAGMLDILGCAKGGCGGSAQGNGKVTLSGIAYGTTPIAFLNAERIDTLITPDQAERSFVVGRQTRAYIRVAS